MEDKEKGSEKIEDNFPKVRDNLGIETSEGLLDVQVDNMAVSKMLMKGVEEKDKNYGCEIAEKIEIFFGKRPLSKVLGEKLREAMERRNYSGELSGRVGELGQFALQIEDSLIDMFGKRRWAVYFHDSEAPFLWFNMPLIAGDTSWGGFRHAWRHELGHFYDAIENGDTNRFQDGLAYLGTACGIEVMAGAGGFLVCKTTEKVADRKKTPEQKAKVNISRRKFLRG